MKRIKIRKGDTVEVITGRRKDRGERGEVIKVLSKKDRVVVQGINIRKKHQRQVQAEGRNVDVGIIEFEGPMPISNVMLVCPKCDQPTRVGINRDEVGLPVRYCKACEAEID
ncbi:MAG: 50S ribosomal protein L24 [Anaerolineae bacterium]|nr:50S ribosomal protein L24 [Anaerolineae bacterium]